MFVETNLNTMENNVFTKQLKYKGLIDKKGLKKGFVADKIGVNKTLFSQFINGRLYMPDLVRTKLDNYLDD